MNAANSAVLGYRVILAPSLRKPCHSSPSSSSHGGAYSVRPVRSLTVSVIGTIGACGLVMVQNLPGGAVVPGPWFAVRGCPAAKSVPARSGRARELAPLGYPAAAAQKRERGHARRARNTTGGRAPGARRGHARRSATHGAGPTAVVHRQWHPFGAPLIIDRWTSPRSTLDRIEA